MNKTPNRTNMSIAFLGLGSFLFVPLLHYVVTRLLLGSFDPLTDNAFNLSMVWISLIPGILTGIFLTRRRELGGGHSPSWHHDWIIRYSFDNLSSEHYRELGVWLILPRPSLCL